MTRLGFLLCTGLLASAATAQGSGSNRTAAAGLHSLAVAAGKLFFGTATDTNLFNDTTYMRMVNDASEFGVLVPENSQKWQPTEPQQNDFVFANPDRVRGLAVANKQRFRCHTLTWFQQLPNFVQTTQWTKATLTAAIQAHISNVVGHYKGQCYSWDVVNEALNENGTFRNSVFFQTLGTDFIPISFRAAAEADPDAKLYYNDFNLENNGTKTAAALGIVKLVQDAGLRIDGVGFQAHMTVGQTPSRRQMAAVLGRFAALGMEVALTELDVRQRRLPPNASAVQQQAVDYVSMVGACLDVAKCVGVVVWEFTDKYSWIPQSFPGTGAACLFDENFAPKPAYTAVSSLLAARATGTVRSGGGGSGSADSPQATPTAEGDGSSSSSSSSMYGGGSGMDMSGSSGTVALSGAGSIAGSGQRGLLSGVAVVAALVFLR